MSPREALGVGGGTFETGFVVGMGVEGVGWKVCKDLWLGDRGSTDLENSHGPQQCEKNQVKSPKRWKTLLNGNDKPNSHGWVTCYSLESSLVINLGDIGEDFLWWHYLINLGDIGEDFLRWQ